MSNKTTNLYNHMKNNNKIRKYQGHGRVEIAGMEQGQHQNMLHRLRLMIPRPAIRLADKIGKRWLRKNISPYKNEIAHAAKILGAGIYTLNTGFEWGCTTMVHLDNDGKPVMHRMLDWGLPIGEFMHAAEYQTPYGDYTDINWAGNSGMINGIARGRFCIAINQAPIPMHSKLGAFGFLFDWIIQRIKTWHSRDWAPAHLLRHVFETAPDYRTAKEMLMRSPLAIPAIFTLCGSNANEYCVIERMEHEAYVLEGRMVCTANHWQNPAWRGHARPIRSHARLTAARQLTDHSHADFLTPPILNKHSIMSFCASTEGEKEINILSYAPEKNAVQRTGSMRFTPPGIAERTAN